MYNIDDYAKIIFRYILRSFYSEKSKYFHESYDIRSQRANFLLSKASGICFLFVLTVQFAHICVYDANGLKWSENGGKTFKNSEPG